MYKLFKSFCHIILMLLCLLPAAHATYVVGTISGTTEHINLANGNTNFQNQYIQVSLAPVVGDNTQTPFYATGGYNPQEQRFIFGVWVQPDQTVLQAIRNAFENFLDTIRQDNTILEQCGLYKSGHNEEGENASNVLSSVANGQDQFLYDNLFIPTYQYNIPNPLPQIVVEALTNGRDLGSSTQHAANQGRFVYTENFTTDVRQNQTASRYLIHTEPQLLGTIVPMIRGANNPADLPRTLVVISKLDMCVFCSRLILNYLLNGPVNQGNNMMPAGGIFPNILVSSGGTLGSNHNPQLSNVAQLINNINFPNHQDVIINVIASTRKSLLDGQGNIATAYCY